MTDAFTYMPRTVEPELMDGGEQAQAYAEADFEAPHSRFIDRFRETFPDFGGSARVLDLGCGPADIARRFAEAFPETVVDGVDGAEAMLACGRQLLTKRPELEGRVRLFRGMVPDTDLPHDRYDVIISNSLLHHLHDPDKLWQSVRKWASPGAPVFIIDLMRPRSDEQARILTDRYTEGEPPVLKHDFYHSLHASFTVDEVREQLRAAGLASFKVEAISDRHLQIHGYAP